MNPIETLVYWMLLITCYGFGVPMFIAGLVMAVKGDKNCTGWITGGVAFLAFGLLITFNW